MGSESVSALTPSCMSGTRRMLTESMRWEQSFIAPRIPGWISAWIRPTSSSWRTLRAAVETGSSRASASSLTFMERVLSSAIIRTRMGEDSALAIGHRRSRSLRERLT